MDDVIEIANRANDIVSEVIQEKFNYIEYISYLAEIQDPDVSIQKKNALLGPLVKNKSKDLISISYLDADCNTSFGGRIVNFSSAPIIQKLKATNSTVIFGPTVDNVTHSLSINIACPVKNGKGERTGILLARLDCKFLNEIASRVKVGKTGNAVFVDQANGTIIGSVTEQDVKDRIVLLERVKETGCQEYVDQIEKLAAGQSGGSYFKLNKESNLIVYEPIKNTSWSICIIAQESELIGKLSAMERLLFFLTIFCIIVSNFVAIFISRDLVPLKKVGDAIREIASGNADLTKRLEIKNGKKEIQDIVNGFNEFVIKLQEIITNMKSSGDRLMDADSDLQAGTQDTSASITQIIANIESVNRQIVNQASSVDETAGSVNEIASNIESLEKMILNQSSGVEQASSAVEEMVGNINSVNSSVDKMFGSFKELQINANLGIDTQRDVNDKIKQIEEQSKMLQDANSAIANIAEQTNLLAMNAAIEAAHAGEAGKGFSVVADEIRKLSETSTNQSKSIGDELTKIQESIDTVVSASSKAMDAFTSVSESIQNTDQLVRQIKNAMEEQQAGSRQITEALGSMNDSTSEVKAASAEMAEGNKHILSEINKLQEVTSMMKNSITEMSSGAQKINETGSALNDVSKQVTESIESIKSEIDQFKV